MTGVVADATPLVYLAKLGDLDLFDLFTVVLVPEAVHSEVVVEGREGGYPDAVAVADTLGDQLRVGTLSTGAEERASELRQSGGLGAGEAAAIALAEARDLRCLTDDHAARRTADSLGVPVGGTIHVLLRALEQGRYSRDEYVSRLDRLNEAGFRMSASLYRRAVEQGDELADR